MAKNELPSDVVANRVRQVRRRRDWTAAQLAKRCAELGAPELSAQTIANIETGRRDRETGRRRRHVTVDELLVLALALDVAPVHLLVPLDEKAVYWVTEKTGLWIGPTRHWIRGTELPPNGDPRVYFTEVPESEWEPLGNDRQAKTESRIEFFRQQGEDTD